jgi:hypothetical protein
LAEDLRLPIPPVDKLISDVEHDMLSEAKRVAPTAPRGQKRILSIGAPLVYRLRRSDQRAATWIDEHEDIFWLLAVEKREEGSDDDAFEYFRRLHEAGRLLPTEDDRLRDQIEATVRLTRAIQEDLGVALAAARRAPRSEVHIDLANYLPARMYISPTDELEELWVAVSVRDTSGAGVNPRLRDATFAMLRQLVEPHVWEWRHDWPVGRLEWFEVAQLSLTAI